MIYQMLLALAATLALVSLFPMFVSAKFWRTIWSDTRGQLQPGGLVNNALADRGNGPACMARIPAGRYPFFSTTLSAVLDANGNADLELEAERDYLFTGLSIASTNATMLQAGINMTYCNTRYMKHVAVRTFARCCDRKPIFAAGVSENKTLEIQIRGGVAGDTVGVTLDGFQGKGCCG